ncbi:hypothetical protein WA026_004572 [Henosepilachna vigintioctopunctata]|uniref:Uncharacterized protein n=1 Tax=Henosepilachna vigintioctopunctata TaxID=420089 RepID=A0AAW1VAD2_9CUCU
MSQVKEQREINDLLRKEIEELANANLDRGKIEEENNHLKNLNERLEKEIEFKERNHSESNSAKENITYKETLSCNLLYREPTHITPHFATCLDNIISDIDGGSSTVCESHISDHSGQKLMFSHPPQSIRVTAIYRRLLTKNDIDCFLKTLSTLNLDNVYAFNAVLNVTEDYFLCKFKMFKHLEQLYYRT